ncbi:MAG TPA: hypothetical protein VJC37_03810, partial [Planctomycetota bacterium]|nr:hypothetical protein [Planctomycetota bacterium]
MTHTMTKWLVGLVMVMAGLGLMGCDKFSAKPNAPEVKPVAPAEPKVEVNPMVPAVPTGRQAAASPDAFVS